MADNANKRLTVGVLGGMGPQATVDFVQEIVRRTPAAGDADHIRILVDCNPGVPDRQAARRGDDQPVRDALTEMALGLQAQGADFLVMPCNTAHAFIADARAAASIPFVSIIDVTVEAARHGHPSGRIGVLATDACVDAELYQRAALRAGLTTIVPPTASQASCMRLIAEVKAGNTGDAVRGEMRQLAGELVQLGADVLVAGCTEIPLLVQGDVAGVTLLSSTGELAQRTVDLALGRQPLPIRTTY